MGGNPESLALILARVGNPHVLPSLHLLQTVLVHFLLGEHEEEDTTGEADGPRDGEMCSGFGQGLSQRSWKNQSSCAKCTNAVAIAVLLAFVLAAAGTPLIYPAAACLRHCDSSLLYPCQR